MTWWLTEKGKIFCFGHGRKDKSCYFSWSNGNHSSREWTTMLSSRCHRFLLTQTSSCITELSHTSRFLCLLKLWPGCKSQLMLNKKEQFKLDKWPKFKIPAINYTTLLQSPRATVFSVCTELNFKLNSRAINRWMKC